MQVSLKNNFHNTECRVRVQDGDNYLSPQRTKRIWKTLCGIDECACSGPLGLAGRQDVRLYDYLVFQDNTAILSIKI